MIAPIGSSPIQAVEPLNNSSAANGGAFSDVLRSAIEGVERSGAAAQTAAMQFMSGEGGDVHSVALKSQRAAIQFEYLLQVRNKLVQAYQETMRMQL
jgi:flagellar hook-basal body complex protein FliE